MGDQVAKNIEVKIKVQNKLDPFIQGYTAAIADLDLLLRDDWWSVNNDRENLIRALREQRDRRVVDRG